MTSPPTLADLAAQPSRVDELAPEQARALLAQLAALQAPLLAKALTSTVEMPVTTESLLLVPDAAARLGIEASYLYELIRQGRVPAVRLGPKYVRIHPCVVVEIQQKGLDVTLYGRYSRDRDRSRASRAARDADAGGVRGGARRAAEHSGPLRARRAADSRDGGTARALSGTPDA
jgi:excisionase family DNA binding protein